MNIRTAIEKAMPQAKGCFETENRKEFAVHDPEGEFPSEIVAINSPNAHFLVKNKKGTPIHFLKLDHCLLSSKDGKRCDFLMVQGSQVVFVELKDVSEGKKTTARSDFYEKMEADCKRFGKIINFWKASAQGIIGFKINPPRPVISATFLERAVYFQNEYNLELVEDNQKTFS